MTNKNVLVFPCGSEIGLEILRSLQHEKFFNLFGASSEDSNHGKYLYKNYIDNIPFVNCQNFIKVMHRIIEKYNIDYIFPAHDSVSLKLSEESYKLNALTIGSDFKTNAICRSKRKTYELFKDKIRIPMLYNNDGDIRQFPVFLKPDIGQGSEGTCIAYNKEEVSFRQRINPKLIVLEYLPGNEYTIDCFTDYRGKLKFVGGRIRRRIQKGISVNSYPVENKRFIEIAEIINNHLNINNAWFFPYFTLLSNTSDLTIKAS